MLNTDSTTSPRRGAPGEMDHTSTVHSPPPPPMRPLKLFTAPGGINNSLEGFIRCRYGGLRKREQRWLVLAAAAVGWQAGFSRGADAFDFAALALKQPPASTPNPHTEIMWIAAPIGRPAGASLACALYDVAPRTFAELLHNYIPTTWTTGPNGCLGVLLRPLCGPLLFRPGSANSACTTTAPDATAAAAPRSCLQSVHAACT